MDIPKEIIQEIKEVAESDICNECGHSPLDGDIKNGLCKYCKKENKIDKENHIVSSKEEIIDYAQTFEEMWEEAVAKNTKLKNQMKNLLRIARSVLHEYHYGRVADDERTIAKFKELGKVIKKIKENKTIYE